MIDIKVIMNSSVEEVLSFKCCNLHDQNLEIHLKNRPPSIHADRELLGRADDRSAAEAGLTYQTAAGLPWALEVGTEWQHPGEYQDLVQTYPDFIRFVLSGGATHQTWYLPEKAVQDKLYQD